MSVIRRRNARRFRGVVVRMPDGAERQFTFELRKGDGLWFFSPDKCWLKAEVGEAVVRALDLHEARKLAVVEDVRQLKMF